MSCLCFLLGKLLTLLDTQCIIEQSSCHCMFLWHRAHIHNSLDLGRHCGSQYHILNIMKEMIHQRPCTMGEWVRVANSIRYNHMKRQLAYLGMMKCPSKWDIHFKQTWTSSDGIINSTIRRTNRNGCASDGLMKRKEQLATKVADFMSPVTS